MFPSNDEQLINKVKTHLEKLKSAIESDSDSAMLLKYFTEEKSVLADLNISEKLVEAIEYGLSSRNWNSAVREFGLTKEAQFNFYLGPMRGRETDSLKMGMFLSQRNDKATKIFSLVQSKVDEIGEKVYGYPCSFQERQIEFYDLIIETKPFTKQKNAPFALFTPFYLTDDFSEFSSIKTRRTVIFQNSVFNQFYFNTMPLISRHVQAGGNCFSIFDSPPEKIYEALTLRICLHELFHSSGPIPLFNSPIRKLSVNDSYATFEELRADLTAFISLSELKNVFGELASLTQFIILFDKLFNNLPIDRTLDDASLLRDISTEQSVLFFSMLLQTDAISLVSNKKLILDLDKATSSVYDFLAELYSVESNALEDNKGVEGLVSFADKIRNKHLINTNHGFICPEPIFSFLHSF